MFRFPLTALAVGLASLSPTMASSEAIATSLSVTFAPGGSASADMLGGGLTMGNVTSLSMAAAQGSYALAGATAGGGATSAVSAAAMEGSAPPVLRMRARDLASSTMYETELFFGDPKSIPGYEQILTLPAQ